MTILYGSVQGSLGLVYGGLAGTKTCRALRLHLDILQPTGRTENYGDNDGIDTYPGVSGSDASHCAAAPTHDRFHPART